MSNYPIQIPGERNYQDNREINIKGMLSQPGDIDEAFRDICALNKRNLTEMRGMMKVKSPPMTLGGLVGAAVEFGLIVVIDGAMDFFCVKHQEKGTPPIQANKGDEPEDNPVEEVATERFQEIGSETPIAENMEIDEDEDLF